MKGLKVLIVILVMAMLLPVSVFSAGRAAEVEPEADYAYVVKNLVNPYFVNMKWGAEAKAMDLGVNLRVFSPDRENIDIQLQIMEDIVQRGYAGIVLVPIDPAGIVPAIEQANRAGIPVVTADTTAAGGDVVTHVGMSNVELAYDAGRWVVEQLGGVGKIVLIEGVPGASTQIDRMEGFMKAFNEAPGIEIIGSQPANYQKDDAMRVAEDFVVRFPEADAYVCFNDSMAVGVVEVLDQAGIIHDVIVTGINGSQDALEAIDAGLLDMTVEYCPFETAVKAVQVLIDHVEKGVQFESYTDVGEKTDIVTKENVHEFLGKIDRRMADFGYTPN